jgi:hypothetical protein
MTTVLVCTLVGLIVGILLVGIGVSLDTPRRRTTYRLIAAERRRVNECRIDRLQARERVDAEW